MMQRSNTGRRSSILKKRRSRSVSPGATAAQPTPKATRRISFSTKNAVREFRIADKETVWCASYEESTDKISNDQITLQSMQSSLMCTTRNDTMGMEMTMNFNRPSSKTYSQSVVPIEHKENVEFNNSIDMDLTGLSPLSTVPDRDTIKIDHDMSMELFKQPMQAKPTVPRPRPQIFSDEISIDEFPAETFGSERILKPAQRPTIFIAQDISIDEEPMPSTSTASHRESTNLNHPMSLQSFKQPIQDNSNAKKKRPTIFECSPMSIENASTETIATIQKPVKRPTIFDVADISIEQEPLPLPSTPVSLPAVKQPIRRPTLLASMDMPMDEDKSTESVEVRPSSQRDTIYTLQDISTENEASVTTMHTNQDRKPSARSMVELFDLSIDMNMSDALSNNQPNTMHRSNVRGTIHANQEMSMDRMQIEQAAASSKPSRQILHELNEMSLERIGQTNNRLTTHDDHNMSMDILESAQQSPRPTIFNPILQSRQDAKEAPSIADYRSKTRRTVNEAHEMSMDTMHIAPQLAQAATSKSSRQTVYEAREMSFEANNRPNARRTMNEAHEMSMDTMHCAPQMIQAATSKSNRLTLHENRNMSLETDNRSSTRRTTNTAHEMSMDTMYCAPQLAQGAISKTSRQTVYEAREMSFEANNRPSARRTLNEAHEMSMDTVHCSPQMVQAATSKSSRQTLYEAEDISVETGTHSNISRVVHENHDVPTSLASQTKRNTFSMARQMAFEAAPSADNDDSDMNSEDMSFQMPNEPQQRQSVIHKSPAKSKQQPQLQLFNMSNRTAIFGNDIDVTQALDTTLHISQYVDADLSGMGVLDDVEPSTNANQFKHVNFGLPDAATVSNISLNSPETSVEQSTAQKYNLNKTPYYAPDPSVLIQSDESIDSVEKSNVILPNMLDISVDAIPSTSHGSHTSRRSCIERTPVKVDDSILNDLQNDCVRLEPTAALQLQQLQRLNEKRQSMFMNNITASSDDYENVKLDSVHYLTMENTRVETPSPENNANNHEELIENDSILDLVSSIDSGHGALDITHDMTGASGAIGGSDKAFKRSDLLHHSNIVPSPELDTTAQAIAQMEERLALMRSSMPPPSNVELPEPVAGPSSQQQPEPVASTSTADDLNETSLLMSNEEEKFSLDDINLAFYEDFHNSATAEEVAAKYYPRFTKILRTLQSLRNGETIDDEPLDSQNVPAPSWTYLWDNKVKCEEEEEKAELAHQAEQKLIGAFLPVTPNIKISIMNKCRELKNWTFDELWFFEGNISLRNKLFGKFAITIIYDNTNEKIDRDVSLYGALQFSKIVWRIDKPPNPEWHVLHEQLKIQDLRKYLPKDLIGMCRTSAHLSAFDEKLHEYCVKAEEKVTTVRDICKRNNARLLMENEEVYIKRTVLDRATLSKFEFIINLTDVDATGWRDVRTLPRRALRDEVKTLPTGIEFIKEFLGNHKAYVMD